MTGVPKKKGGEIWIGHRDRHTGRIPHEDKSKGENEATSHQRTAKSASISLEAGREYLTHSPSQSQKKPNTVILISVSNFQPSEL